MLINILTRRATPSAVRLLCLENIFNKHYARNIPPSCFSYLQQTRLKYTPNKGVKGVRNRKHQYEAKDKLENADTDVKEDFEQEVNLDDR